MKLSDLFVGWYDYSDEDFNEIMKNGLISFDTNVLLNMYKYSIKASNETFKALVQIKDRIVTSYYVAREFTNNRKKVKVENVREYEKLNKLIDDKFSEMLLEINNYGDKKLSKINEIATLIMRSKDRTVKIIDDEKNQKYEFYKKNEIEDNIANIFLNNIVSEYDQKSFALIKKEGLRRFSEKIPPGYMDDDKEENGDYYIFKSLIDYCKCNKKDLIFITNDKKQDWFRDIKGIKEPREELLNEFYCETNQKLIIMDFDNFIKSNIIFQKKIADEVVDEIYEINKSQDKMVNRGEQRIQRYLFIISKYYNIDDIKKNIDEIQKYYRTISRICDGLQDYRLLKEIEKLQMFLNKESYDQYIKALNNLNLQIRNYKNGCEIQLQKLYTDFVDENSINLGIVLLEKLSIYIRDYLPQTYTNRLILSKTRELRLVKRNDEIDDYTFIREVKDIYDNIFGKKYEVVNNLE